MKYSRNKNGQSILEFCLLTICCAAALIAMSGYIMRAMQGAWKEQADELGIQYAPEKTIGTTIENSSRTALSVFWGANSTQLQDIAGIEGNESLTYFVNQEFILEDFSSKTVDEEIQYE